MIGSNPDTELVIDIPEEYNGATGKQKHEELAVSVLTRTDFLWMKLPLQHRCKIRLPSKHFFFFVRVRERERERERETETETETERQRQRDRDRQRQRQRQRQRDRDRDREKERN